MLLTIPKGRIEEYRGQGLGTLGKGKSGILIEDFWSAEEIAEILQTLETTRALWYFFPGVYNYSSFGNPLYAFRATNRLEEYFQKSAESDAKVQRHFPGLEEKILSPFRTIEDPKTFQKRARHSGPAFVIQDDRSDHYAHYDLNEGLKDIRGIFSPEDSLYTVVGMLKKPKSGGRLFLWNRLYDDTRPYIDQLSTPPELEKIAIDYPLGSLLIVNGMKLHEIEESKGERITVNCHLMRTSDDNWTYWF